MDWDNIEKILLHKSTVFSKILAVFPPRQDNRCPTAGVGPGGMMYNKAFLESLASDEDRAFIIAHECEHIISSHIERCRGRDPFYWNVAADYNVNLTLVKEFGFRLPKDLGVLYNEDYAPYSTETLYERLMQDKNTGNQTTLDDHSQWSVAQTESYKEAIKKLVASLDETEKSFVKEAIQKENKATRAHGLKPGDSEMGYQITKRENSALLASLILDKSERETTWRQPNRRLYSHGVYLPSRQREKAKIAICIDTSGSTKGPLAKQFVDTVAGLIRSNDVVGYVIHADSAVHKVQPMKEFDGTLYGGGGTSFIPAITKAESMGCRRILYFTDLEGTFPSTSHNVIWIVPKDAGDPPFGRKIALF